MATTFQKQILTYFDQTLTFSQDVFQNLYKEYLKSLYISGLHKNQFHIKTRRLNMDVFYSRKNAINQFKKQIGIKNKLIWSMYQNQIDFNNGVVESQINNTQIQSLLQNENNFDDVIKEPQITNNSQYLGLKKSFVQSKTNFVNKTIHQHPKYKVKRIFTIYPNVTKRFFQLLNKDIHNIQAIQQFLIKGSTYTSKKQRLQKEVEPFITFIAKFLIINRNERQKYFAEKLKKNRIYIFLSNADLEFSYQFIINFTFIDMKQKYKLCYQQDSKRQIIKRLNKLEDLEKQLKYLSQTSKYDADGYPIVYFEFLWMIGKIGVKLYLKGYLHRAFKLFRKGVSLCLEFKQKLLERQTINKNAEQKFLVSQSSLYSKQLSLFFLYFHGFLLLISAQFKQQNIFKIKAEIDDFLSNDKNLLFDSKQTKNYLFLAYLQMIRGFGIEFEEPQLLIQLAEREENLWKIISNNNNQRQNGKSNMQSLTLKSIYPFQNTFYCMKFQCFKHFLQERKINNKNANFISLRIMKKCLSYLSNLLVNNRRENIKDVNLNFSLINELLSGLYAMSCWYYNDEILETIMKDAIICVMCLRIKFKSKEIRDELVYIMKLLDKQHIFPQKLQNYQVLDEVEYYVIGNDNQAANASIIDQHWTSENNNKSYQLLLKILYLTARLMFKKNLYFKCFIILDFYCHLVKKQSISEQVTNFFNQNHQSMLCERLMFKIITKYDHRNLFNHVPFESKLQTMETFIIRSMRKEVLDGANRKRRMIPKTIVVYGEIFNLKDLKNWHVLLKSCNLLLCIQKIFKNGAKYRINYRTRLQQMLKNETYHHLFHQISKSLLYLKNLTKKPQQIQSLFNQLFTTFQNRQQIILNHMQILQQQYRQHLQSTKNWKAKVINVSYRERTINARKYQ